MERVSLSAAESVEPSPDIVVTQLAAGDRLSAQHVWFGPDTAGSEHSHPHEQVVYVTAGSLVYYGPDGELPVRAGDSLVIPGDEIHGASNPGKEPAEVIEVFSPPRETHPWEEE